MLKRTTCVFTDHDLAITAVEFSGTAQERLVTVTFRATEQRANTDLPSDRPGTRSEISRARRDSAQGDCFTHPVLLEDSARQSSLGRATWQTMASELISYIVSWRASHKFLNEQFVLLCWSHSYIFILFSPTISSLSPCKNRIKILAKSASGFHGNFLMCSCKLSKKGGTLNWFLLFCQWAWLYPPWNYFIGNKTSFSCSNKTSTFIKLDMQEALSVTFTIYISIRIRIPCELWFFCGFFPSDTAL